MPSRKSPPGEGRHQPPSDQSKPSAPPRAARAGHAVGQTAEARAGQGSTTAQGADWMAERIGAPDASPDAGVPVSTSETKTAGRGKAVESRRGAHRGG